MSDTKTEAPVTVVLSGDQHAAQKLAAELADMRARGLRLDKAPPGGRFMGTDGQLHDSEGHIISDDDDTATLSEEDVATQLRELDAKRDALRARLPAAQAESAEKAKADSEKRAAEERKSESSTKGKKK